MAETSESRHYLISKTLKVGPVIHYHLDYLHDYLDVVVNRTTTIFLTDMWRDYSKSFAYMTREFLNSANFYLSMFNFSTLSNLRINFRKRSKVTLSNDGLIKKLSTLLLK